MSEPLVLIPGLQSDASSWLPLLERLGRHFPLTVPRGHQFATSIGAMAGQVVRQSPQRFHLVGWSMVLKNIRGPLTPSSGDFSNLRSAKPFEPNLEK